MFREIKRMLKMANDKLIDISFKIMKNNSISINKSRLFVFFSYITILILFYFIKIIFPDIFAPQSISDNIKDIIPIIYGLVGTFVAIMVPLHYSLSFNILGEMEDALNNKSEDQLTVEQKESILKLKHYCHTAEGLIFSFAVFGALVLFEEAFVVGKILGIQIQSIIDYLVIIVYFYALWRGLSKNMHLCKEWALIVKDKNRGVLKYMIIYFLSIIFSGIWGGVLLLSECHNFNAFMSLILVIGYYLLWIYLRDLFAPLSSMRSLLMPK